MTTLSRHLASELRTVFRRLGGTTRISGPAVCISTGSDGTRVSTKTCDVAAEYHVPGNLPEERLWAPLLLLSDCEGKQDEPVQLERSHDGSVNQLNTLGVKQRLVSANGFISRSKSQYTTLNRKGCSMCDYRQECQQWSGTS